MELIDLKNGQIPWRQAKVINYRLIEERSQTFNEGLFLPYFKLYDNVFEKSLKFYFKI